MATSLFPTSAPQNNHIVSLKAGRMIKEGNLVSPDLRKGLIYVEQGDDGLMHFCWKDRKTNSVEEDLIVFPGEAEFIKVTQSTGRVYLLKFSSSSQRLFFWLQDASTEKDADLTSKLNRVINNPSMDQGNDDGSGQEQLLRMLAGHPAAANLFQNISRGSQGSNQSNAAQTGSQPPSTAGNGANKGNSSAGNTQLDQLHQLLSGITVPEETEGMKDVDLSAVLTVENIRPLLSDKAACEALFPHLTPNTPHTKEEVQDIISSPQFSQAVHSLTYLIQSGQVDPLLAELGIESETNHSHSVTSVSAFLRAIQKQVQKEKNEDAMDES